MAEAAKEKKSIKTWWEGIRTEWGKIVWPDGPAIGKRTFATILSSIVIALLIAVFDMFIQYGVEWITTIGG